MLHCGFRLVGLELEQVLVEDHGEVRLRAQKRSGATEAPGDVHILAGVLPDGLYTLVGACRRGHEENHDEFGGKLVAKFFLTEKA
jgi:hypothetical protein